MFERTITIDSMGKTFSVTGWKVGWAIAPPPLSAALRAVHQFVTFTNAAPFQEALADVLPLAARDGYYAGLRADYQRRRELLAAALRAARLDPLPIDGAYFLLADVRAHGVTDDVAFCRRLIAEVGVAAIPTSVFYADPAAAPPFVRFCFAKSDETLCSAAARLAARSRHSVTTGPTDDERLRARAVPADQPVMRQIWRHLGFLHWPIDGAAIAALLPPGLDVDTFDGVAYVGLVPFTIPLSRTPRLGLPIAPPFHEVNLRTYVHRGGRDPGVWFFSLDAASRLAVAGARLGYHLPYFHARMSLEISDGPSIAYRSRRLGDGASAELSVRYGPTGAAAQARTGSLEFFLFERYRLYASDGRALWSARVPPAVPGPVRGRGRRSADADPRRGPPAAREAGAALPLRARGRGADSPPAAGDGRVTVSRASVHQIRRQLDHHGEHDDEDHAAHEPIAVAHRQAGARRRADHAGHRHRHRNSPDDCPARSEQHEGRQVRGEVHHLGVARGARQVVAEHGRERHHQQRAGPRVRRNRRRRRGRARWR